MLLPIDPNSVRRPDGSLPDPEEARKQLCQAGLTRLAASGRRHRYARQPQRELPVRYARITGGKVRYLTALS
jgi:hypothetical protein